MVKTRRILYIIVARGRIEVAGGHYEQRNVSSEHSCINLAEAREQAWP
jgi:hypothetical protein